MQPLVRHAGTLAQGVEAVLGTGPKNSLLRRTFFRHFCAGASFACKYPLRTHRVPSLAD